MRRQQQQQQQKTKNRKVKAEKRISAEKLRGYNDTVCEFVLCTFNLLNRIVNLSWLFIKI